MSRRVDVLISGGGPVGMMALLACRAQGLTARVIERAEPAAAPPEDFWDPRVYALNPSVIAALKDLGVWNSIPDARHCGFQAMRVWSQHAEAGLNFLAAQVGRDTLGEILEHGTLLTALRAKAEPADLRYGIQIESLDNSPDGVKLRLSNGERLSANLLIAADGAESASRTLAGIETTQWSYRQQAVVCYLRTAEAHDYTAWQRFADREVLAFLPMADGRCSIVWSVENLRAEALMNMDDADFADAACQALGGRLGEVADVERRYRFDLGGMHALSYVRDSVVLAGDAAHVVHPLAGQGVNLGIADVLALADHLAKARANGKRINHPRVLARYARERLARNQEMLAITDGLHRAFGQSPPWLLPLLATGMQLVNSLPRLKSRLVHEALGL